uniref:ADAM metallopeptidase domain 28 n=1 Tax=Maylandia zebra TaxID=106582 RepID=A0A3P9B8Z9_9CICH
MTLTVYTWTMTRNLLLWRFLFFSILNPVMTIKSAAVFLLIMENKKIKMNDSKQNFLFFCPQYHRPDTLTYAMTVGGQDIEMQLERNNELLTKDYTESYYQEDGTRVTTVPNDIDHCFYHGRIVNDSESSVSISTCDGLRGYFRTSAQRYLIEPLSSDDEGDHAVMTFNEKNFTPAVCGVTNTSWSDDYEPPTSSSRSRSGVTQLQQKYVELVLVADNRAYVKMNRDQKKMRQRIFEIVNFVNMVYKPLRTFIALVGLEIWTNGDLISVTPPAGANLDAFMKWRNSELVTRIKHDNAHLIRYG